MTTEKSTTKFVFYGIFVVLLLFGLIRIVIGARGKFFMIEAVGLLFLLLLATIGLAGYTRAWGERALFFVFLFYLANLVLIWYASGSIYLILLFLTLVGFLMSLPKKSCCCCETECVIEKPMELPVPVVEEKTESVVVETAKKTVAKHSPGKYLGSKRGNVYHEPKCDWAKRINKVRRVWFNSKDEARKKGYKAHSCVK